MDRYVIVESIQGSNGRRLERRELAARVEAQQVTMCGRYSRWSRRQRIEELLGIEPSSLNEPTACSGSNQPKVTGQHASRSARPREREVETAI